MIAKLIVHGATTATMRSRRSVDGSAEVADLAGQDQCGLPRRARCGDADFVAGEVDTGFIAAQLDGSACR